MSNLENGMAMLKQKQDQEDTDMANKIKSISEHMGEDEKKALPKLIDSLSALYEDMIKENYTALDNSSKEFEWSLMRISNPEFENLIVDKCKIIRAGLKDREATKFNAATKAVREMKELLQEIT